MQLTNVKVTDAKKVKEGEGEYGPWELWNLTLDGQKYSWFRSEKDPSPQSGMVVAFAEYKEEQKGQYTNRNINGKSLKWGEKAPDKAQAASKGGYSDFPSSMLFSYIKDIVIAKASFATPRDALDEIITLFKYAQKALAEPEVKDDNSAYLKWLQENSNLIDEESWANMCATYDVKTLKDITDREHQKEIFAFVKNIKEAKEDPFGG